MTGLRVLGALLLFIGATFAIFTAVVAIDQLYAEESVDNGRVIAWLIGGGIYAMVIGTVLVIPDAGRRWDALDRRWDAFEET